MREVMLSVDVPDKTVAMLVDSLDESACESLIMMNNEIVTELPPSLCKLQALTLLNLDGCSSLRELPSNLAKLQALTSLDLSYCDNLRELPSNLGELQALTSLDLRCCDSLSGLPESLSELQALTSLNLEGCSGMSCETILYVKQLLPRCHILDGF